MKLSNSRRAFRKAVWNSSSEIWCRLHEEAFAKFGGTPHTIRLDNLKEGVLKPDVYDPQLNPLYTKMLEHYGVVALPCRPYAPDLKGKVESEIGYTQDTALKGRRFESIEEQNTHLDRWDERWAMTRIHGTIKRQMRAMFEEEKTFLQSLPLTRFEYYRICQRTVHFDGHIEVDGTYYSAPPRYAGHKIVAHIGKLWLRLVDPVTHECIFEHPIALHKGQRRTVEAHRPKQTPIRVEQLAARVAGAGPGCKAFATRLLEDRGATALRARSTACSTCSGATKQRLSTAPARSLRRRTSRVSSSFARTSRTMLRRCGVSRSPQCITRISSRFAARATDFMSTACRLEPAGSRRQPS